MLKLFAYAHGLALGAKAAAEPLRNREEGQTMAEYGVILAVITIGILAALGFLSGEIQAALRTVAGRLDGSEG